MISVAKQTKDALKGFDGLRLLFIIAPDGIPVLQLRQLSEFRIAEKTVMHLLIDQFDQTTRGRIVVVSLAGDQ